MRLLSILAVVLFSLATLHGQTTLTIKGQNGKSWQNYGDDFPINGYDQNISHYGFSAEIFRLLTNRVSIGVAPGFMRRGAACEPGFFPTGDLVAPFPAFDATVFLDYVQLPVLVRVEFPIAGRLSIFGQGGAGLSYLAGGYREITFFGTIPSMEERRLDFDGQDENLNRFDFGWSSTLGFGFRIGKGMVRVSGEHYYGFLDMNQNNTSLNRNWGIGLGYQISLSKLD